MYQDRLHGLTHTKLKLKYGRDVSGLLKRRGLWVEFPIKNIVNEESLDNTLV